MNDKRLADAVAKLRVRALRNPWHGQREIPASQRLLARARSDPELAISCLLTFDTGYHASGWWRNSDYDRCWHLSVCGMTTNGHGYERIDQAEMRWWARRFFGDDVRFAWIEPPASVFDTYRTAPASRCTWHVRVFVDRSTNRPIIPQGEVYDLKPWAEGDSPAKVFR